MWWHQVMAAAEDVASAAEKESAARREAYRQRTAEAEREFERGELLVHCICHPPFCSCMPQSCRLSGAAHPAPVLSVLRIFR